MPKLSHRIGIRWISWALFFFCVWIGVNLAKDKPVEGDEVYSQTYSITAASYPSILLGKIREGNPSPLFYLIQKIVCDLTQFRNPPSWRDFFDPYAQVLLRAPAIVAMALAVVVIYFYFVRQFNLWTGLFSVVVSLSSFMLWIYWTEARPYPLWLFFTTSQCLLCLNIVKSTAQPQNSLRGLLRLSSVSFLICRK